MKATRCAPFISARFATKAEAAPYREQLGNGGRVAGNPKNARLCLEPK